VTPAARYAAGDGQVPLARLLALAFGALIEDLHARLAERGWHGIRPAYGYVLVSAQASPCRVSDVARVLGVTKQAASQVVDAMAAEGYVRRDADPADARARVVALTERGRRLLAVVEDVYRELEGEWAAQIGADGVARMRADLLTVVSSRPAELRAHSVGSPRRGGSSTG
jgi:DNA-binding MarR family transcriptional regulator